MLDHFFKRVRRKSPHHFEKPISGAISKNEMIQTSRSINLLPLSPLTDLDKTSKIPKGGPSIKSPKPLKDSPKREEKNTSEDPLQWKLSKLDFVESKEFRGGGVQKPTWEILWALWGSQVFDFFVVAAVSALFSWAALKFLMPVNGLLFFQSVKFLNLWPVLQVWIFAFMTTHLFYAVGFRAFAGSTPGEKLCDLRVEPISHWKYFEEKLIFYGIFYLSLGIFLPLVLGTFWRRDLLLSFFGLSLLYQKRPLYAKSIK